MHYITRTRVFTFLLFATVLSFGEMGRSEAGLIITPSLVSNDTILTQSGTASRSAGSDSVIVGAADSSGIFVGSTVVGQTRYVSTAVADNDVSQSPIARFTLATDYTVSFSIADPGPGVEYTVDIESLLRGSLDARNDGTLNGPSGGSIITDVLSFGDAGAALGLNTAAVQGGVGTPSGTTGATAINQSTTTSLGTFTGANTFTLTFTWSTEAWSAAGTALSNPDEHAVRLGVNLPLANTVLGVYPGVGARDIDLDGHFVNVTVQIVAVPEPASVILAGSALVIGAAYCVVRRRRR